MTKETMMIIRMGYYYLIYIDSRYVGYAETYEQAVYKLNHAH